MCFSKSLVFGYLRFTLLSIVEKLAGGGSVAVAVDVSEIRQVAGDMRHVTGDR